MNALDVQGLDCQANHCMYTASCIQQNAAIANKDVDNLYISHSQLSMRHMAEMLLFDFW